MKSKKITSLILAVCMLAGLFSFPVFAVEEEVKTVYKASEAWNETTSGDEYWSWEHSDMDTDYGFEVINGQIAVSTGFGTNPTDTITSSEQYVDGNSWKNGSAWNFPGVGQYWMIPLIKTSGTTSEQRAKFSVSKTFKAPVSGDVTLSTEDGYIYANSKEDSAANSTAYVRITRNGVQIWPESGELQIPRNADHIQPYEFKNLNIKLYKGDVLRFEVYNGDGSQGYGKRIYWAPVVTYSTTEADANMVYNSLDVWSENLTSTSTVTNVDPVWQFLYRNTQSNNQYKAYTLTKGITTSGFLAPKSNEDGTYDYTQGSTTETSTTIFSDSTSNADMRNALGKYWMRLSVATGSEPKQNANNRIVKSFTAPRSGNVCISAIDMLGDSKIYNKGLTASNNKGAVVNILKWKPDGTNQTIWTHTFTYNTETQSSIEVIDFENMSIYVNKGEMLWFMVSGATGGSAYAKHVFWTPVVSYYDTKDASLATYKATDAWSTDANNKYNGHNEWKWEQYDNTATTKGFKELSYYNSGKARFGQNPKDSSTDAQTAPSWDQSSNVNLAGVGQYWMTPRADSSSTADVRKAHAVARAFTAPKAGAVVLSSEDVDEKGIIHTWGGSPNPASNAPSYIRITKNGTQIWPKYSADGYVISATTTFSQDAPITSIALTVNQGDVIRFEAYNGTGDVGWGKRVYWRPTVEYIEITPSTLTEGDVSFKNASDVALTTFSDIVSAGNINVSFDVNTVNYASKNAIMCVAVYDETGILENVALSTSTPIASSGKTTFTINGMEVTDLEGGFIKVFLFDSMDTLYPVSDIGATPIYTTLE